MCGGMMMMMTMATSRGSHATALIGRKLFVFGGYGGDGYARKDFNDLYSLDLDTWEWESYDNSNTDGGQLGEVSE